MKCDSWAEHEWKPTTTFVEIGTHPTRGRYEKRVVRCEKCGLETIETTYLTLLRDAGMALFGD